MAAGGKALERMVTPAGDPVMTAKFLVPVMNAPVLERPRLVRLLTEAVAAGSPQLRQCARAEHQQHDDQNDDQVTWLKCTQSHICNASAFSVYERHALVPLSHSPAV